MKKKYIQPLTQVVIALPTTSVMLIVSNLPPDPQGAPSRATGQGQAVKILYV